MAFRIVSRALVDLWTTATKLYMLLLSGYYYYYMCFFIDTRSAFNLHLAEGGHQRMVRWNGVKYWILLSS